MRRLFLVCSFAVLAACGSTLADGYRAHSLVRKFGDRAGGAIAAYCKSKRLDCEKIGGDDVEACKAKTKCAAALRHWVHTAKPAVNTALAALWAGLETARLNGKKDVTWIQWIKPGLCALGLSAPEWKEYLGSAYQAIKSISDLLKGVACE